MLINTGNISRKVLSKVLRSFVKNFERLQSEGIYYEVYVAEDLAENDIVLCGASVSVTREVIYSGVVKPQKEISWREKINGSYYSGVLTISKYSYTTSQTVATYTGVLYKE